LNSANRSAAPAAPTGVAIALGGSGGSGVMTAGTLLLAAAAKAGAYGLMVRTSGPQIRGGEAAALVRLADRPVDTLGDAFDLLLAIDWSNINRFADEVPLTASSVLVGDPDEGEPPDIFKATGARYVPLQMKKMAKAIAGSWVNMVALGFAGALAGLPQEALEAAVREDWKRGEAALAANLAALAAGFAAERGITPPIAVPQVPHDERAKTRWSITGNEAAGFGAIRGGVRFVAAYPITPATELLEWMAPALAKVGGTLLQAEDELASINMIIGGSFGGVPSLTATAGPGLALAWRSPRKRRWSSSTSCAAGRRPASRPRPSRATCRSRSAGCTATRRGWCCRRPRSPTARPRRSGPSTWPRSCRRRRSCCRTSSSASRGRSSIRRQTPGCARSG